MADPSVESPEDLPRVSERERKALGALVDAYRTCGGDFSYMPFRTIAHRADLDIKHVRRAVRSLARKDLAKYARGLWSEDDRPVGAGYAVTATGLRLWEALRERESNGKAR